MVLVSLVEDTRANPDPHDPQACWMLHKGLLFVSRNGLNWYSQYSPQAAHNSASETTRKFPHLFTETPERIALWVRMRMR